MPHVWFRRYQLQALGPALPLLLAVLLLAPRALAQQDYETLVHKGIAEYERGHWLEARAFFERAHALAPSARTLRSLGMTAYELRSYVEASGYFEAALRSQERPLTETMRNQLQELLRETRTFIARLRVTLSPAGAELRVDGQPPVHDAQGDVLLEAGEHELSASAPGHRSLTRRWSARAASSAELRLLLPPMAASAPGPQRTPAADSGIGTQRKVALGLGVAGVLSLGVAAGCTALMLTKNAASNDGHCTTVGCDARGIALRNAARSFGDVATVAGIAGALLVGAGVITYFTGPAPERATALRLTPAVSGVSVSGVL